MASYILAHDLGTTGNKASLFNEKGQLVSSCYREYKTYYPGPRMIEQDPHDWLNAIKESTRIVLEKSNAKASEIAAIGLSTHQLGCIPMTARGELLRKRVFIWSDSRSTKEVSSFFKTIPEYHWYSITGAGLRPENYPVFKIQWLRHNEPEIYEKADLFVGTKGFITYWLTGVFSTDHSEASGTGFFDIHKRKWSDEILAAARIDRDKLVHVYNSHEIVGKLTKSAAADLGLKEGIPVVAGGGDVSTTALGTGLYKEGRTYNYIGSSSWISTVSYKPLLGKKERTYVFCHVIPNMYSSQVATYAAGITHRWAKDNLFGLEGEILQSLGISAYEGYEKLISNIPAGSGKLIFLPGLNGGGTIFPNPAIRGSLIGLGLNHTKGHILRSVMEGIAFDMKMSLDLFESLGVSIPEVRLTGGMPKSAIFRQILADVYGRNVCLTELSQEAASLGAAIIAGIGVGVFKDFSIVDRLNRVKEVLEPNVENFKIYEQLYKAFRRSYEALLPIFDDIASIR